MDKTSIIEKENQEALINDKKFNRVFEEYIDKDLSRFASNLTGDYWITLISVYDIFNSEIEDFETCNFLKKKATIKLLKSQQNGENINQALGGSSDDFVDMTIYENFADKNEKLFLKTMFSVSLGILLALLVNLFFVFMGLVIRENDIYNSGYVYFSLRDFQISVATFTLLNPFTMKLKNKLKEKYSSLISYIGIVVLTVFMTTLYLGIIDIVFSYSLFTIPIPFMIYIVLFIIFAIGCYGLNKIVNK